MIGSAKGKLLVFAVFMVGVGSGALGAYEYQVRVREPRELAQTDRGQREQRAQQDVDKFHDYLGLTQEQRTQVRKLIEENRTQFRTLQAKTRPEFKALQEETRSRIRMLLNDEQKQKYDDFFAKQQQRRQRPRIN